MELTNFLKNLLKSIKIDIHHYDPAKFQKNYYTVDWSRYPPNWNLIGHSRIYLIPYLLYTYHEPVLYLDCDTGVIYDQTRLYDTLINCPHPFMNAKEGEQVATVYGENHQFTRQLLDIKLYYHKTVTTPAKSLFGIDLPANTYPVTIVTRNNGIMYFPTDQYSLRIACEITLVYEKLMEIYAYGFNDLNAASCVFETHKELQCSTMIPYRIVLNTDVSEHKDSHMNYLPIELTHYFTTSWLYYGQQNDHDAFENIITVYRELTIQSLDKPCQKIKNIQFNDEIIGPVVKPCENVLETIFFPKRLISIFHPFTTTVSFASLLREQLFQTLRIKRNSIILSYITFILMSQPTIWTKLATNQQLETLDWYNPTENQLDMNQLGNTVLEAFKTNFPSIPVNQLLKNLTALHQIEAVNFFLQVAQEKFTDKMLLNKNSANCCPSNEKILRDIKDNNVDTIMKYLAQIDPNQLDDHGFNLIHLSVAHNRPTILQLLLSQRTCEKPNINALTSEGQTACHLAVKYTVLEPLIILLRSNANCLITDMNGKTPKELAIELNLQPFSHMLASHETKIQHKTRRQRSTIRN